MQSKSQNKKQYNDIKNNINILNYTPGNKASNYINLNNNNMNNKMNYKINNINNKMGNKNNNNMNLLQNRNSNNIEIKNDKIFMKMF